MDPQQVRQDIRDTESVERPSFVLVENGTVLAHFPPGDPQAAADAAYRLTERDGRHVDVYEVDCRLQPPPAIGSPVDPDALGWVNVN